MPSGGLDDLTRHLLNVNGQASIYSQGNQNSRLIYPAIVLNIDDPNEQGRIIARIINLDQNGKQFGGRDRDVPDDKLPFCIPLDSPHHHCKPMVGEMVYIHLENPSDNSAPRYFTGPVINSKFKLKYQEYSEAIKIFDDTKFPVNNNSNNQPKTSGLFPEPADIALQGRDDADLMLKSREVYLVAGKFKPNTFDENVETPSYLQLKQFYNVTTGPLKSFSQVNLQSSNVNIYSPLGKFRSADLKNFETNEDLNSFGDVASRLHPTVFGDELIKLFDIIIRVIITHIHTPQSPLVPTPDSTSLQEYSISGKLQDLLSKHVRIN